VTSGFIFRVTVTGGKGHAGEGLVSFPVITVRKASGKLKPTNHQSFTSTPERILSFVNYVTFTNYYDVGKVLLEIISGVTVSIVHILGVSLKYQLFSCGVIIIIIIISEQTFAWQKINRLKI